MATRTAAIAFLSSAPLTMPTPEERAELVDRLRLGGPNAAEVSDQAADEIERLRAAVERKQQQYERSQRYWVDAAQKAIAGDFEHLRLRVDMALAGPIEMTETAA